MLWVYDVGDSQILAFTQQGIESVRPVNPLFS